MFSNCLSVGSGELQAHLLWAPGVLRHTPLHEKTLHNHAFPQQNKRLPWGIPWGFPWGIPGGVPWGVPLGVPRGVPWGIPCGIP